MDSPWSENIADDRRKASEELVRGKELTHRLQNILGGKPNSEGESASPEDILKKIAKTFTKSISILNCSAVDEVSQSLSCGGRNSEDSGESSKRSRLKSRKGCYKRRRTTETRVIVTDSLVDDGQAWRKYGQKVILNAKYPRNYYRCTHMTDQGCKATKVVQRTKANNPKYCNTYYGYHTCRSPPDVPEVLSDSASNQSSSSSSCRMLSFVSNKVDYEHHRCHPFFASQTPDAQDVSGNQSLLSDYLFLPDATMGLPGNIFDSTESNHGFSFNSLDLMSCSVEFDDALF